jgi:hypothetical protein
MNFDWEIDLRNFKRSSDNNLNSNIYDSNNFIIEEQKCEKCGKYKNFIISKDSYKWFCNEGCEI